MSKCLLSVIIATYQDAENLSCLLNSIFLSKTSSDKFEVTVVDDGSTDHTREVISRYEQVHYYYQKNSGPAIARNFGASKSKTDILIFLDSDTVMDEDFFNNILDGNLLVQESVAGVGGIQLEAEGNNQFGKAVHRFLTAIGFIHNYVQSFKDIVEVDHNPSCVVCYKSSVFKEVGGFAEGLFPGEDLELDRRIKLLGYKLFFNPNLKVQHKRPEDISSYIKMMRRYGEGAALVTLKHGVFRKTQYFTIVLLFLMSMLIVTLIFDVSLFGILLGVITVSSLLLCVLIAIKNKVSFGRAVTLWVATGVFYPFGFMIGLSQRNKTS